MYFVAERQQEKEFTDHSIFKRLKSLGLNLYIFTFVIFDLAFIKKKAYEAGVFNLSGLYCLLCYFFLAEGYGLYMYLTNKQRVNPQEISWRGTIFWHVSSLAKIVLFGLSLSSSKHQYLSVYFMVRFTIYASTFFLILSHLRVVRRFVLRKDELNTVEHNHARWQMGNFNKVFYASLLGNTVDVIAFGNDLNFYCWLSMIGIWTLYEFNKLMEVNHKWNYLKHIFESE